MSDEKKTKYNAVCGHCGAARYVWLTTMIGASPVFCSCGSIMTLSGSEIAVVRNSPQASNVRRNEVPAAELCLLGMMTGKDGKSYPRQEVFEALMRQAFTNHGGLAGYTLV